MPESSIQRYAPLMGAQIKLREEECALSMGQSLNVAALKAVQIKSSEEECAKGMEHRLNINGAAVKGAQGLL